MAGIGFNRFHYHPMGHRKLLSVLSVYTGLLLTILDQVTSNSIFIRVN